MIDICGTHTVTSVRFHWPNASVSTSISSNWQGIHRTGRSILRADIAFSRSEEAGAGSLHTSSTSVADNWHPNTRCVDTSELEVCRPGSC
jgi:hypothetical protein